MPAEKGRAASWRTRGGLLLISVAVVSVAVVSVAVVNALLSATSDQGDGESPIESSTGPSDDARSVDERAPAEDAPSSDDVPPVEHPVDDAPPVGEVPPVDDWSPDPDPGFEGHARALPEELRERMTGVSWHPGCPVGLDDLALVEMTHHGFDGQPHTGEMVVAERVADDVLTVFEELWAAGFPIERVRLIEEYDADDDASMVDNNSSAFNCRAVTGSDEWSEHSYGTAIDLNPVQNPYVRDSTVLPPEGQDFLDRSDERDAMIVRPDPVIEAFEGIGWGWGGDWDTLADYMHFSESGR